MHIRWQPKGHPKGDQNTDDPFLQFFARIMENEQYTKNRRINQTQKVTRIFNGQDKREGQLFLPSKYEIGIHILTGKYALTPEELEALAKTYLPPVYKSKPDDNQASQAMIEELDELVRKGTLYYYHCVKAEKAAASAPKKSKAVEEMSGEVASEKAKKEDKEAPKTENALQVQLKEIFSKRTIDAGKVKPHNGKGAKLTASAIRGARNDLGECGLFMSGVLPDPHMTKISPDRQRNLFDKMMTFINVKDASPKEWKDAATKWEKVNAAYNAVIAERENPTEKPEKEIPKSGEVTVTSINGKDMDVSEEKKPKRPRNHHESAASTRGKSTMNSWRS